MFAMTSTSIVKKNKKKLGGGGVTNAKEDIFLYFCALQTTVEI